MSFSEVVKLLSSSNQTGALNILDPESREVHGQLFFQMGQLVDAVQEAHTGLDALQELCSWIDADFAFEEAAKPLRQSLISYPTEKLLEKIKRRTTELESLHRAMPKWDDVPVYCAGKESESINANPEELSILLLCTGEKNVNQIAFESGHSPDVIARTLARFRHVGIVEVMPPMAETTENPVETTPVEAEEKPTTSGDQEAKPVRYWRGHKVE